MRGRLFSRSSGFLSPTRAFANRAPFNAAKLVSPNFSQSVLRHTVAGKAIFPYGMVATITGAAVGGYMIMKLYEDEAINAELPTYREMRQYRDALKTAFCRDNIDNKLAHRAFDALLNAISSNNPLIAEEMLNDLIKMNAIVTPETRDSIIVLTANHNKINILELLQQVFGVEEVSRNRHARHLLSLTPEQKERATHFMEQCFQSPGEIKHDGMIMFVAVSQHDLLDQMIRYRAYQPVFNSFDAADDITETCREVLSVHEITRQMQTKFKRTIIVDLSANTYQAIIEDYYKKLAQLAKNENDPVVGTMITTGSHFTISQIRVVQHASGSNTATVVFIDPRGSYTSMLTNDYGSIASIAPDVFDDVHVFISEERNQLAGMGCSLFVSDQYATLMTLDDLMRINSQYPFAGNTHVLFDYVKYAQTSWHPYGIDFDYDADSETGGSYAEQRTFALTRLPVILTIGKQSLAGEAKLLDAPEVFVEEPSGRF